MEQTMKVYLAVPYEEKDKAKALGARWDPRHRCWYAGDQGALAAFERWLPKWALEPGETIRLPVLLLPTTCYLCHRDITCVVGLRLPEDCGVEPSVVVDDVEYLALDDCCDVLDLLLDPSVRAALTIGPLLYRRTRIRPEGYLANVCSHCGSTQGAFPLYEDVIGFLGGDPTRIPLLWSNGLEVEYPLAALAAVPALRQLHAASAEDESSDVDGAGGAAEGGAGDFTPARPSELPVASP
jgi:hypothetical protein